MQHGYRRELLPDGVWTSFFKVAVGTESSLADFRETHRVVLTPSEAMKIPPPALTFESTCLPRAFWGKGTSGPSRLQSLLWPPFCCGADLVVSGRIPSAEFDAAVAPLLVYHVMNQTLLETYHSPIAIVITTQLRGDSLHSKLQDLCSTFKLRAGSLTCPVPLGFERIGYCPDIVVCTPGRLQMFDSLLKKYNRTTLVVVDDWSKHVLTGHDVYITQFISSMCRADAHVLFFDEYLHSTSPLRNPSHYPFLGIQIGTGLTLREMPPDPSTPLPEHWSRNPSSVLLLNNINTEDHTTLQRELQRECPEAVHIRCVILDQLRPDVTCAVLDFGDSEEGKAHALAVFRIMHGRQYSAKTISAHFAQREILKAEGESLTKALNAACALSQRTLMLRNVIAADHTQINHQLRAEIEDECACYGILKAMRIVLMKHNVRHEGEAVRIFLHFVSFEAAAEALVNIDGRQFGGRGVNAILYDEVRYLKEDLNGSEDLEPPLPLSCMVLS